ncbi:ABC transporter ATP-binding protein [Pseudodesulfovibrio piezophilus]|uniref:High-affinity branched-chain amino acid transport ATP-binding protein BraG n=1 Tax=Pseudodesulfovibrio piezophilus (strain DSM 21447 / JCM 15486 / C1TLV30) TaxID=1322246 RepID=M1WY85_PSEP2|nr:ABC transporter ATP-binding protein [Pseudodesulfovibrio piezophilus]CCH50203.1 High-affinity branched-chain amino acid transport ATP-binding protein BraG [Pseudodesulfovibrio piezophilus C1TLV30]
MPLLDVNDINVSYGDVQVLFDLSISIEEGEVVSIIGGNGAGKSTLLKTISGLMQPESGSIGFMGAATHMLSPDNVVETGLIQVPEGRRLFSLMSVRDNLMAGAHNQAAFAVRRQTLKEVYEMFPRLKERESQLAMTLSGGEQQMVAIGRGLMAKPKLLMLDEPSLGLAPVLINEIFQTIRDIADKGLTVLLVEQDVNHSLNLSERGYVLEHGRIAMQGTARELLGDPYIKEAYLGI